MHLPFYELEIKNLYEKHIIFDQPFMIAAQQLNDYNYNYIIMCLSSAGRHLLQI